MGHNATVIVLTDALEEIKNDPEFGKNLVAAIGEHDITRKRADVRAGCHVNAGAVIEAHHADQTALVALGGNYGSVIGHPVHGWSHHEEEKQIELLKKVADQLGYRLVKKPSMQDKEA